MKPLALVALVGLLITSAATAQQVTKHPADGEPNGGGYEAFRDLIFLQHANDASPAKLTPMEQYGSMFDAGYVTGIADALNNDLFCIPAGVDKKEVFAVVNKFHREHPDHWNNRAALEVAIALALAYPCKG